MFVRVEDEDKLGRLARHLQKQDFHLVTLIATDERELIDGCFKLTYLFSPADEDLFLFVEHPLVRSGRTDLPTYISLYPWFRSVDPFEREMADMMGLLPNDTSSDRAGDLGARVHPGDWLHPECYPPHLAPLRRHLRTNDIRLAIEQYGRHPELEPPLAPGDGEWLLPVGPVHAAIIPPARFLFRLAGEAVEAAAIRLGYTHKGIERVFQSDYTLEGGWQLAEHVAGDSAFAHSLAYCLAAENLARVPPPPPASYLRALFLELERIANHIGDCASLCHDVGSDLAAAELAALREEILRLLNRMVGHRLLRGLNRPGGVALPSTFDSEDCRRTVTTVTHTFAAVTASLRQMPAWRQRLQWQGILTRQQALDIGATGLVARASGVRRDARRLHPTGAYNDEAIQVLLRGEPSPHPIAGREATAGDALARFLVRVHEVASSAQIIEYLLHKDEVRHHQPQHLTPALFPPAHNYEFGVGCIEGWRGDIVYWLMQDRRGRIFRCKVRDPSYLNWPSLKAAIEPHELDDEYIANHRPPEKRALTLLADFPIINKSFNLSYSGNDL
jgi:Ni,Fe-hydrogenase III large subunit/Ni,Fe-hydrogenase III component G